MSDLMREEFEAWFSVNVPDINNLAAARAVKHMMIKELAFLTWQASREFLVIELPEKARITDPSDMLFIGSNGAINKCRDAIHAAGVKTK